jgi:hypothetical protein
MSAEAGRMRPRQADRGGPLGDPEDARGVTVPLRPELVLVSTGTTLTPAGLVASSRRVRAVGLGQAHGDPHRCQACQTQRRSAAGCTPSAPATSPTGWPAPTSPTAWTRTALGEVDHDPPPSRPPGPPEGPGRFGLGAGLPSLPPVPRCVLPSAGPAGLGAAGRVPTGIAVLSPTGMPASSGGGRPGRGRGRGRVGGKPGQHRSDRLGLLLRKAATSLAAQQLHLVREPWRPWSCPSTPAAVALAGGGLAWSWLARRIGVGVEHARLLARPPTATGAAGRVHG